MIKPVIGIPLGDPAGIGPEIVVKALQDKNIYEVARPVVIGDKDVITQAAGFCSLDVAVNVLEHPEEGVYKSGTIDLIDLGNVDITTLKVGEIQALGGKAAFEYIEKTVEMALCGQVVHVEPAIEEARALGYKVAGPIGADSVFHLALQGRYNSVLSLYHDQGHIATKTLDFERTIAITNGLPFLRTSVDHGTAFDIAGIGKASAVSMTEAILLAAKYSPGFKSVSGDGSI